MSLVVAASLADRDLDVSFEVARGETVAILGPNGAGKSTALAVIAGLLRPDAGAASWEGTTLFDTAARSWLPPHRRGVALLAQEALLFPHLSVLDNVAFGPRSAGASTDAARATARRWLTEVEASELAVVRPARLSGGQAQRIAIARALAAEPDILLLDEPFAALDVAVAPTLRRMLRRVLAARTAIVVTHEVLDALMLADRVIVMNRGRIVETGATAEVLEHPRHPFTAELAGLNLLSGTGTATGLRTPDGIELTCRPLDGEVFAAFRPTAVTVHRDRPAAANVFRSAALDLEPRGDLVRMRAGGLFADLSPGLAASLDLEPGGEAWFSVDPDDIAVYPS